MIWFLFCLFFGFKESSKSELALHVVTLGLSISYVIIMLLFFGTFCVENMCYLFVRP
ncbi:hypothetical protein HanRHA438_Chr09g0375051 [Helianthus annuus]|nr:hypothetical protein HanRHA438_Chr09g0375051 [Helianthus annuus]